MDHHDAGDTKSPHDLQHSDVAGNSVNGNNGVGGAGANSNGLMGSNGNTDVVDDNDEDIID